MKPQISHTLTKYKKNQRFDDKLEEIYFRGNNICKIDENIFKCLKLRVLVLNNNNITNLADDIGNLIYLKELYLRENKLIRIPINIKKCINLRVIDFSKNRLKSICDEIFLPKLKSLDLCMNFICEIPNFISLCKNLEYFNASFNFIKQIPNEIAFLTNLRVINLGSNRIYKVPTPFPKLPQLTTLKLNKNYIKEIRWISYKDNLQFLDLSNNYIRELDQNIDKLLEIEYLDISNNKLFCIDSIDPLKKLRILNVNYIRINYTACYLHEYPSLIEFYCIGSTSNVLSRKISQLSKLKILEMDYNKFVKLPDDICHCRNIEILRLRGNRIRYLPDEIGDLENMQVIDLCDNDIEYLPLSVNKWNEKVFLRLNKIQVERHLKFNIVDDPHHGKILTNRYLPQNNKSIKELCEFKINSENNKSRIVRQYKNILNKNKKKLRFKIKHKK